MTTHSSAITAQPLAIHDMLNLSRECTRQLAQSSSAQRDAALEAIAARVERNRTEILQANAQDIARARQAAMADAMLDRLLLTEPRVSALAQSVRAVIALPDPLGEERSLGVRPNGLAVSKRRVALGVIAVVYEARPNVTVECASLTIKSGNALILRGGKEALATNVVLAKCVSEGLSEVGLNAHAVQLVTDIARERVVELLGAVGKVDLCIPRGGAGLMQMVDECAKVPVIRHGQGICHVYIDAHADADMATAITVNSKTHRPGVCNATETLLIHRHWLEHWPALARRLSELGVELRCDERALSALNSGATALTATELSGVRLAQEQDWSTEFLSLILAVKTVDSVTDAMAHIARYGSGHSASIVTNDATSAELFLRSVETSCVLHNASTRFNDGSELGLGAEIGISTSRMHAWGPMGLRELTAEKFVVRGAGQVRH
jgi:glutamate-5-semialdehyde dehydrogenase